MTGEVSTHDRILDLLFEEDEITWQSILFNLVTKDEMDPWDVDITKLAKRFFEMVKKLKDMDFRVPGKVILAAALLLRIKSAKLVDEDILELDQLIASTEQQEDYDDFMSYAEEMGTGPFEEGEEPKLIPRTPQPRTRKVSIYDLVDALEKALEVRERRVTRAPQVKNIRLPDKGKDIGSIITGVFKKITDFFAKGNKNLKFSQLIPDDTRDGKVYTFIPLLHLTNQRRIDLFQNKHFGEIEIELLKRKAKVK
ncbi:MAG: segregation/condensation protein A [Nanoarchaeota archaeon]|nr:segregation/condensation protein A [Nanoarchaeota archaeon]